MRFFGFFLGFWSWCQTDCYCMSVGCSGMIYTCVFLGLFWSLTRELVLQFKLKIRLGTLRNSNCQSFRFLENERPSFQTMTRREALNPEFAISLLSAEQTTTTVSVLFFVYLFLAFSLLWKCEVKWKLENVLLEKKFWTSIEKGCFVKSKSDQIARMVPKVFSRSICAWQWVWRD